MKQPAADWRDGRIGINRLGAEVELRQAGEMSEINSGIHRRTPRGADGRDVIMHQRVAVERQPAAHEGQPPGEVEAGMAGARILAGKLDRRRNVIEAGEGIPERSEGNGNVALAAKNIVASKSEFHILCWLKAHLLPKHVRPYRKLMPRECSEKVGRLEWPQEL